ncbi:MAG: hypothetical protein MK198_04690 [Gracilimonas sp.]|uniref:hypothetical protein n=1 Tax=Gracilimonas sp. TaxID=1974203 RepID=UPI00375112A8|nr:hypothetical protein [Gracilimonas sp.]
MLRDDMEERYDGVTTFKIGEVARRADVNKEAFATTKSGSSYLNPTDDVRATAFLTGDILTKLSSLSRHRSWVLPSVK